MHYISLTLTFIKLSPRPDGHVGPHSDAK